MADSLQDKMVLGILACFSMGTVLFAIRVRRRCNASKHWPSTRGIIVSSTRTRDPNYDSATSPVIYGAEICYEYSIEGQPFTGSRVTFGDYSASWPAHARGILIRYPVGREVLVYYDPKIPSFAVLERELGGNWILVTAGCLFAAVSLFLLLRN